MENENVSKASISSTGLKFGLMMAVASIVFNLILYAAGVDPMDRNSSMSWVNSVVGAVITITFLVLAHKAYKENGDGFMSYGQGFGIAMVAVLVSTIVTCIYTYLYLTVIDPDSYERIWEKALEDMEASGQSQDQIDMGLQWGKRLFWPMIVLVLMFWGTIIGLIVTIFTQKKAPEQAF